MAIGTEQPSSAAGTSTESVLAVFEAGRRHPRRGPGRRVGVAAAGAFAAVSLLALVMHDPGVGGRLLDAVGGGSAPIPAGSSGVGLSGTNGASGPRGAALAGSTGGAGFAAVAPDGSPSEPFDPGPGNAPSPGGATPDVAVVSPTLRIFSFGSTVGLPLVCSVALSAVIAQVADPTVAQVATTVVTSCIEFGSQGADALTALNGQLGQLAVLNPAATPVIDALVSVFNTAGASDVPFGDSIAALGRLIGFFSAPSS